MKFKLGVSIILIFSLLSISCKTKKIEGTIITKSCELNAKINDTVIISGVYGQCIEYESFRTIEKDSCSKDFKMDLYFFDINKNKKADQIVNGLECNERLKIIAKGILKKSGELIGHDGSLNAEFEILEVYKLQKK